MAEIRIAQVTKTFAGGVQAVDGVDLTIPSGEFTVLVGPSGCGKTTLLRMIAGLEEVTAGEIWIGDREVSRLAPRDRDIAMVFQNYALYPHLTVAKNLAYPLKVRKQPKADIDRRVREVARLLGLEELLGRRPGALSGGQRQRVAMGRALIREPAVFLMDEPLSNLDAKLRVEMRTELARLHERLGITTVYVTHDQVEAMTLGTRVAVMRDGRIQQVDAPHALYREPADVFVASFIGSPSMNLAEAKATDGAVEFAGFSVQLEPHRLPAGLSSGSFLLGIRPQDFRDAAGADPAWPVVEVEVAVVEDLGSSAHVIFPVDAAPLKFETMRAEVERKEDARLLATDTRALFTAEVSESTRVRPGHRVRLAIDPSRLHFFDRETGRRLA